MAYPRSRASRAHKKVERTAGSVTLNAAATTAWEEVAAESGGPGTGGFDIVLAGQVGDDVEVAMSALLGNEAVTVFFDIAFMVSGAPAGWVGATGASGDAGVQAWRCESGAFQKANGGDLKTLTSGLIATTGLITLRPYFRAGTAATAKTLFASAANPFRWWAKNLGPPDPN
jgi:hypothetical protein